MAMMFEDLEAWQESGKVVNCVYNLTREANLSKDFGLKDQIQRAAVSVMSNIAEGFERTGTQEKLHFYNIARASAGETRSLLYVIEDNYPGLAEACISLRTDTNAVGRKITGLITSFRKRQACATLTTLATLATLALLYYILP